MPRIELVVDESTAPFIQEGRKIITERYDERSVHDHIIARMKKIGVATCTTKCKKVDLYFHQGRIYAVSTVKPERYFVSADVDHITTLDWARKFKQSG